MLHLYFELIGIKFTAGMKILNCMSLERKNAPDKKKTVLPAASMDVKKPIRVSSNNTNPPLKHNDPEF